MNKADSFKKKYFYKILTNLISIPISLAVQLIIPRALGPVKYGNFNYITSFFQQIISFFDSGSSAGFYTKLSQRQNDKGLTYFFFLYFCLISILLFVLTSIFQISKVAFWPNIENKYILFGLIFGLLTWYSQIISSMVDAFGYTKGGELIKIGQKSLGLILILIFLKYLDLDTYFYYSFLLLIVLCFSLILLLKNKNIIFFPDNLSIHDSITKYFKEIYKYSSPLFVYAIISTIVGIFDRWLLQIYGGSAEQGFFGLSYQIGAVCFIFTSAMTPLIMREYSIAFGENNIDKMRSLFSRYVPLMFTIASFLSIFISVHSEIITYLVGGKNYKNAVTAIALMSLYPIHQTFGQLSSSVFFATGQTKLYRNLASFTLIIGIPITFLFIGPVKYFGLNLGSTGLSIKMLIVQFLGVNFQLWYNCKYLKLSFFNMVKHQVFVISIFFMIAFTTKYAIDYFLRSYLIVSFFTASIFYFVFATIFLYFIPTLISSNKQEIQHYISVVKIYFKK